MLSVLKKPWGRLPRIRFAPVFVPAHKWLEVIALLWHVLSIPSFATFFMLCCAFPPFWPFALIYVAYMWFDKSPEDGSPADRFSMRFRSMPLWRYYARYFPITLHKTVDLEPTIVEVSIGEDSASENGDDLISVDEWTPSPTVFEVMWKLAFWWYYLFFASHKPSDMPFKRRKHTGKRYIFGYHPHGIIGMGLVGAMASEGAGWSELFPGVPVSVLTLTNQFIVPFYRDYLMALGMGAVAKHSCEALLRRNQSICIVVGGAHESLLARPGHMDLVLEKRKGFVKLALEMGNCDLVPVLAFGENDVYDQVDNNQGTLLYKFQTALKKFLGFTLPLMHARGVFNYDVGIIPYRRPINVVVGSPISVPHKPDPTQDDINYYQRLYIQQLNELFEKHKHDYYHDYTGGSMPVSSAKLLLVE
ncbi:diacylglycerol O-acyltransferase 1 [Trichomonascus vanleenenianus]|uniref:diacylglycerol O-acyltransferase n=1 Tax=Trichomonascus vanleenenianus TaxID=2268995 RepID=UPI003ECB969B